MTPTLRKLEWTKSCLPKIKTKQKVFCKNIGKNLHPKEKIVDEHQWLDIALMQVILNQFAQGFKQLPRGKKRRATSSNWSKEMSSSHRRARGLPLSYLSRKKDGSLRFCVDYRKLNDVTKKGSDPFIAHNR